MKLIKLLPFLVLLLTVFACGGETIPIEEAIDTTSLDTLYITATDTIGTEFGDDSSVFAFLVSCGYTPEGNIAVLDAQKNLLQIFDPSGVELMQVGRSGQGPGEYQMPLGLAITGTGYVVSDLASGKMILFDSEGLLIDEINDFGMMPPAQIFGTTGENYLAQHLLLDLEAEDGPTAEIAFVAFGDSSEPETVFESYPLDMQGGMVRAGTQIICAGGLNGEAILVEQSDSLFRLVAYSAEGDQLFQIEEQWERIPLTDEELAEDQLSISMMITEEGTSIDRSREPRTDEYRTIADGVGVDYQGRIWVLMGDTGTPYFRVYSPQGELVNLAVPDESISQRAEYVVSPYGFLAFDPDPDDWPKIYLLGVSD